MRSCLRGCGMPRNFWRAGKPISNHFGGSSQVRWLASFLPTPVHSYTCVSSGVTACSTSLAQSVKQVYCTEREETSYTNIFKSVAFVCAALVAAALSDACQLLLDRLCCLAALPSCKKHDVMAYDYAPFIHFSDTPYWPKTTNCNNMIYTKLFTDTRL